MRESKITEYAPDAPGSQPLHEQAPAIEREPIKTDPAFHYVPDVATPAENES